MADESRLQNGDRFHRCWERLNIEVTPGNFNATVFWNVSRVLVTQYDGSFHALVRTSVVEIPDLARMLATDLTMVRALCARAVVCHLFNLAHDGSRSMETVRERDAIDRVLELLFKNYAVGYFVRTEFFDFRGGPEATDSPSPESSDSSEEETTVGGGILANVIAAFREGMEYFGFNTTAQTVFHNAVNNESDHEDHEDNISVDGSEHEFLDGEPASIVVAPQTIVDKYFSFIFDTVAEKNPETGEWLRTAPEYASPRVELFKHTVQQIYSNSGCCLRCFLDIHTDSDDYIRHSCGLNYASDNGYASWVVVEGTE